MKGVFVDTFFYVALLNSADQHHEICMEFTQTLQEPLVTTEWVLVELANTHSNSLIRQHVSRFIANLENDPGLEIIPATTEWFHRGLTFYAARHDKAWSLIDCISMEVMRKLGVDSSQRR